MTRAHIYVRNLAANWIGYGANLAVMFFLSPFVVHRLGDTRYGVWSLLVSLTGYLGLVELGTRSGLGRFVNFYLGKDDIEKVNSIINTALAIFMAAGLFILVVAGVVGVFLGGIFPRIPTELIPQARTVLILVALNLWLAFLGASFRQVLTAFERFDLGNAVDLGVLSLRTGGTIAVLSAGGGLVELAIVQVVGSVAGMAAAYLLSKRVFPQLTLKPHLTSTARFREIFGFGIWAFFSNVAMRLLYTTDTIVIAILLGPKQVTFYAIAGMLIMRGRGLVTQCSSVFRPQMIKDCATSNWPALRNQFRRGSMVVMAVAIPLLVGLIVFGKEFIILWMGPRYAVAYPVLLILSLSQFPALAVLMGGAIYSGLHRVKLGAILTLLQGIINLGLTLAFVMIWRMGIEGVAWGTFYPRVVFAVLAGVLAMRWIGLPIRGFVTSHVFRWLAAATAFAMVCVAVDWLLGDARWGRLLLKVGVVMLLYLPLAWLVLLTREDKERLSTFVADRFLRGSRAAAA